MVIFIVGVAHTKALVLDLTAPTASQRQKRRIATDPLLTTRRFHQRRRGIATEATMLASNRLGFHTVVSHRVTFCEGGGAVVMPRARCLGATRCPSLYPIGSSSSQPKTPPRACGHGGWRAHVMSQLSKVKHSRDQWKHKATQRGDHNRSQRKQIARLTAECHRVTAALKAAQARLRQLESPPPELVADAPGLL